MTLKELRETKLKVKAVEMAKILDVTPGSYWKLENGDSPLSIKNAIIIHEHFGLSLDEIYGITKEQQEAGLLATNTTVITPLEDDLLEAFRTIGENLGEQAQRGCLAILESIAKNSQ